MKLPVFFCNNKVGRLASLELLYSERCSSVYVKLSVYALSSKGVSIHELVQSSSDGCDWFVRLVGILVIILKVAVSVVV